MVRTVIFTYRQPAAFGKQINSDAFEFGTVVWRVSVIVYFCDSGRIVGVNRWRSNCVWRVFSCSQQIGLPFLDCCELQQREQLQAVRKKTHWRQWRKCNCYFFFFENWMTTVSHRKRSCESFLRLFSSLKLLIAGLALNSRCASERRSTLFSFVAVSSVLTLH